MLSGFLLPVWVIWFTVAFFNWYPTLGQWTNINEYANSFQVVGFLAWVIPCFLLALTFMIFMVSIYSYASQDRKSFGLLGVAFAVTYSAVLGAHYYLQTVVIPQILVAGRTNSAALDGISLLVLGSPNSIFGGLEAFGYGIMGLSLFFAAPVFSGSGRWNKIIKWLFLANVIQVISFFTPLSTSIMIASIAPLILWIVTLCVGGVLVAVSIRNAPEG